MWAGRAFLSSMVACVLLGSALFFGWQVGVRGLMQVSSRVVSPLQGAVDRTEKFVWHEPPLQNEAFFRDAWRAGIALWGQWQEEQGQGSEAHVPYPLDTVQSMVVPHHLLVAPMMAALFHGLGEEVARPSHILLLSPNHFFQGQMPISLSERGAWVLPNDAELFADSAAARRLADLAMLGVGVDEDAFHGEHGVSALLPFVARAFPNVPLVPVAIEPSVSAHDAAAFGRALAEAFPHALLVASVDFSHELPREAQEFHDAVSRACLQHNGCDVTVEVDAPSVLQALWAWNAARGTEQFQERSHTSSLALGAAAVGADNTSHFVGFYIKGEPVRTPFASFLFTGDIMLDRRVRRFMNEQGVAYPWKWLSRWIMGTHAVVGNLEGTVNERPSKYTFSPPFEFVFSPEAVEQVAKRFTAVSLANNHARDVGWKGEQETHERLEGMRLPWFGGWESSTSTLDAAVGDLPVTYIGYHALRPAETELLRLIAEADARGRFVVVLPHWGVEYSFRHSREQERLATAMVKAGADLVVGMHPHVVQDVGVVNGVPVFYSLGNFIFDQEIAATWPATGMGVIVDGQKLTAYPLPLFTRAGQPKPLEGQAAAPVYERLALPKEPFTASVSSPMNGTQPWYTSINFIQPY